MIRAFEESLRKEGSSFDEYKQKLSDQILISHFVNKQIRRKSRRFRGRRAINILRRAERGAASPKKLSGSGRYS